MATKNEKRIRSANDEIMEKGNLDAVEKVFAAEYVLHTGGKHHKGPAFVKRFVRQLRTAIPDLRIEDITILLEKGDTIAWQRTLRGRHESDLSGIPPSHKKVEWSDMIVTRFDGEQITEEWAVSDLAGQLLLSL